MNIDITKPIKISRHALEKMADPGVLHEEIEEAIPSGKPEPARKGRVVFRKNFPYNKFWRGKYYAVKQVVPIVAEEKEHLLVVTVYNLYH